MIIPVYYSYKDFIDNYKSDFAEFQSIHPSADVLVFGNKIIEICNNNWIEKIKNELVNVCDIMTKRIYHNFDLWIFSREFYGSDSYNIDIEDLFFFTDENNDSLIKPNEDNLEIYDEKLSELLPFIQIIENPILNTEIEISFDKSYYENLRYLVQPNNNKFNDFWITQHRIKEFFINKNYLIETTTLQTEILGIPKTETNKPEFSENIIKIANIVFSADTEKLELLRYFEENFSGYRNDFTDLTKYNQIYFYFNFIQKIPKKPYQLLIKELFGFDYGKSEIKGENEVHQTTLKNLHSNFKW